MARLLFSLSFVLCLPRVDIVKSVAFHTFDEKELIAHDDARV